MDMEQQYREETLMQNTSFEEDEFCSETPKYVSSSEKRRSDGFDCNICLDSVQDPVVTLCGHLFCWPCIYRWLHYQDISAQDQCHRQQQDCPVCKAEISHSTLVPLYGRFQTSNPSETKSPYLGPAIPRRPPGPACGAEAPTSPSLQPQHHNYSPPSLTYYPSTGTYVTSSMLDLSSSIFNSTIGMFGESIYARTFGNAMTNLHAYPNSYGHVGNSSARLRRHLMQAEESLSRICFFFFCCLILCLLSF